MALTMSFWIVMRGIGCTLTLLFALSAQAIDYEAHRHDVISEKLRSDAVLTTRDFLERLNLVRPKASYTLQEATEYLLHFGALLRARILDNFGGLLYMHYDDFSITEVEALHKVYREIFERRYDLFDLIPDILNNPDTRPSRICTEIYGHAESCLRSSANVCRRINRRHDLPHPDDFRTPLLNTTYLVYRSSKISKQYPKGFSVAAALKLLQREALTITPGLLSGFLYNARYDGFDDDIRLAERELVRYFNSYGIAHSAGVATFTEITRPMSMNAMPRKFHSVSAFLRYYIDIHADKFPDGSLKRHAALVTRRIVDDVDTTLDENIQLLGNVYENRAIHVRYLFDLVLADDVLERDVIEAKRYLVRKLNEFNIVERHLKIQKYLQATPAQLVMEITGQLEDIGFVKDIATSLRMHARFWRKSVMIESLEELLELFDAYENLRQLPRYERTMAVIDTLKRSLWVTRDVPVEILCNSPRACLRLGLQLVLKCKFVNAEIKTLITSFLELGEVCVMSSVSTGIEKKRLTDSISLEVTKARTSKTELSVEQAEGSIADVTYTTMSTSRPTTTTTMTTTTSSETYESEEEEEEVANVSIEMSSESTEKTPGKHEVFLEESREDTTITPIPMKDLEIKFIRVSSEQGTTAASTTTSSTSPTTITTTAATTTTTVKPTTVPTTTTTTAPTTTTTTTTTTVAPTTTTTESTTTEFTTSTVTPTTTTVMPTTTTTVAPATTTTLTPTTTTTVAPTTTTTTSTTWPTTGTTSAATTTTTTIATVPSTTITTTSQQPGTITTLHAERLPIITMKLNRSEIRSTLPIADIKISTTVQASTTPATLKSCESSECISEQSSEETSAYETPITMTIVKQNTTWTPMAPAFNLASTTYQKDFQTTARPTTDLIEMAKGADDCSPCSIECGKRESTKRCVIADCPCAEVTCDSMTEDCDGDNERMENHTVGCSRMRCKEDSAGMSTECETESRESEGNGCVTVCSSDLVESDSCEGDEDDDCSTPTNDVQPLTVDVKYERTRKRTLCEIRDPHHRRQLKRLARMRAISVAAAASSRGAVLKSRISRRRDRITTKKLYNMLIGKLSRSTDKRSKKLAEYLLKGPPKVLSNTEGENRREIQRDRMYSLNKEVTKGWGQFGGGSTTARTRVYHQTFPFYKGQNAEKITRKEAQLTMSASHRKAKSGSRVDLTSYN